MKLKKIYFNPFFGPTSFGLTLLVLLIDIRQNQAKHFELLDSSKLHAIDCPETSVRKYYSTMRKIQRIADLKQINLHFSLIFYFNKVRSVLYVHWGLYRVRQKYPTIWQHNCERYRWRGVFVLERPSNETQSTSVAMECWSVQHWAFAVETYF